MEFISFNMPLVESDTRFVQIHDLIDAKRKMLIDKQKKLKNILKQNSFLDAVRNDYTKYYNYISSQKQDQIKALELLNEYINDLTTSGKLSKHNIDDAKFEQERITHEVNLIKKGLDEIINNTNAINSELK